MSNPSDDNDDGGGDDDDDDDDNCQDGVGRQKSTTIMMTMIHCNNCTEIFLLQQLH